ncbi:MAG TPA: hypothetical protein VLA98_14000 [Solirubrobacteraceae bacterium]|nr:hypothetical protein [Solirubrobacteraceae bacterium]
MDNFRRGDRAALALGGYAEDPLQDYNVADLIADLLHLCQRHGFDIAHVLDAGVSHYGGDVVEQAWEYGDWPSDTLQDAANLARARQALACAGVPDEYRDHALSYVGLLPPRAREEDEAA